MGTSLETRPGDLDTSLPGVRLIQSWIRAQILVSVQLVEGTSLSGIPAWLDSDYLALHGESGSGSSSDLVLINRAAIALLRPLA
ncbi:MAG: Hfq-related RNA-binding protein [Vulcanococcus sp.]|jgi:host factor-I protein